MHGEITLLTLCFTSLLALAAEGDLLVSTCDDAEAWRGGTLETELVKEGAGAIRWVPSESLSLKTEDIPRDWSAGNCLKFWMHSAKATGSPIWVIVRSEDDAKEGMDYYLHRFTVDWEGWRELMFFVAGGRVRSPVGLDKIDYFELHAAWNPDLKANPEDALVIDGIRMTTVEKTRPPLMNEDFFATMDLAHPGLEAVRAAVEARDMTRAKAEYQAFFLARREEKWFHNWYHRPQVAKKRINTSRADDTLEHIYHFSGERYELGPDIDWTSNQRDEGEAATIEWNAALNRHFFFRYLAAAYWGTLEDKYAAGIIDMMRDWIEDSPLLLFESGNAPYHFAWETLNVACRAGDTWIDAIWRTADSPAWTPEDFCLVIGSLTDHARHLMKWPSRGNWLTAESKAIAIIGMLLPEFTDAAAWRETGIERLHHQMSDEIYPDGLENELALGYNNWVLRNYANILDLAALNDRREEIPADYQSLLEGMYDYQLYATAPDGRVPGLNDSGPASSQALLAKGFEYFPERKDFQWGATRGKESTVPQETSRAFDYSGHYVMRSGWDRDARYMLFDGGLFGSGHQHEDKLTFWMAAHGRDWIVEGGSYMYDRSRWRRYVLSTRGHNTTRVDGEDQNRRRARHTYVLRPPFEPLGNPWLSNDEFDYVSATYGSGYGPKRDIKVAHQREVLFVKPDYWIIVDTFEPEDEGSHEYETIFHISAETAQVDGTHVSAEVDGKRLELVGLGDDLTVEVVKGIEEEPVQGWANYPWRAVPTALFRNVGAGRIQNAYVLHPTADGGAAPVVEMMKGLDGLAAIGLNVKLPGGETHCFVKLNREGDNGLVDAGPISTDADMAVVKLSAEGEVIGAFAIGGTTVRHRGAEVWSERD